MADYIVRWEIDVFDVDTPEDAAHKALEIQRDPGSTAVVFDVRRHARLVNTQPTIRVDLDEEPGTPLGRVLAALGGPLSPEEETTHLPPARRRLPAREEVEFCDECGATVPEGAESHQGKWHQSFCSLFTGTWEGPRR